MLHDSSFDQVTSIPLCNVSLHDSMCKCDSWCDVLLTYGLYK